MPTSPQPLSRAESLAPVCEGYLHQLSHFGSLPADFYLLLGAARTAKPVPSHFERGEMRQCYKNAGQLATSRPELAYCEGYALRAGLIPVHHAWCLDPEGFVVDTTWPYDPDNEYWGVSLATEFLLLTLSATGVWGILGEMLPRAVADGHPDTYLHPQWRPEPAARQAFWDKLQSALQRRTPAG